MRKWRMQRKDKLSEFKNTECICHKMAEHIKVSMNKPLQEYLTGFSNVLLYMMYFSSPRNRLKKQSYRAHPETRNYFG